MRKSSPPQKTILVLLAFVAGMNIYSFEPKAVVSVAIHNKIWSNISAYLEFFYQ
jgi:hypothetical protein